MPIITITRGFSTVVDDDDYSTLAQYSWYAVKGRHTWYAARKPSTGIVYMHRVITGAVKGFEVDHRDGDGLNNRRENLRVATRLENASNSRMQSNSTGYRGV